VVSTPIRQSPVAKRTTSFEPDVARAFGQVARALREEKGAAQDELALIANVDRSYYGKLERGERQPSLALLLKVAAALEIAGGELVSLVEAQMVRGRRRRSST
jgi:transcriptional regulator with XRE-family HTH domain